MTLHSYQPVGREKRLKLDERQRRELAMWAAGCAARVLEFFEEKYSDDVRPRRAIEAARKWAGGELRVWDARMTAVAAHAAAREAEDMAARLAARAAGHAAATAHAAGHARGAALYAIKAIDATGAVVEIIRAEREWQCQSLPEHLVRAVLSRPW
jgi:hypothetical protein